MKFGQYRAAAAEDVKARRKTEEQLRNQKAQMEAQKAAVYKKQRQILECQEQIRRMDRYAERSLMEGQEKKAYQYLEQKQVWQNRLVELMEEAGISVESTSDVQKRASEGEHCQEISGGSGQDAGEIS